MIELSRRAVLGGTATAVAAATVFNQFAASDAHAATPLKLGTNAMIEGTFRANPAQPGNFEALLLNGSNLLHYWRDNSTLGFPWHSSVVVSSASTGPACLVQSSFRGTSTSQGNFEALVLEGNNLWHYWRDNSNPSFPWHRSVVVSAAATGPATMIQSSFRGSPGSPGNFEALVPEGNNLWHYWRDNSNPSFPWHRSVVVDSAAAGAACLLEGGFRSTAGQPGNFEALVQKNPFVVPYWRDNSIPSFPWHPSVPI